MKIAQVCPRYYPYIGGIETTVEEVSERLVRKGINVEILTQDPLNRYQAVESINGVTVRRFKTGTLGLDFPWINEALRQYLRENASKYDLIHAHSYHAFPAFYAAKTKGSNKLIFNPHYHGRGHTQLMSLLHIPYRLIGKTVFEKADKVVFVSETEKSIAQKHFSIPEDKIVVISSGVNESEILRATPYSFNGKLLLYVGRLEKYKNIHLAIEAIVYLPNEYSLKIIGSGPYEKNLMRLIYKLHLTGRVQIISGLSNKEVYQWYKTCDLVLNLSNQEAFGLTVLEGLTAGKPVLVNNKTALAEMAAKFDQVYPVDAETLSPMQLARHIVKACDSKIGIPDLSQYSWDSIVEQIKSLYESLF